MSIPHYYGALKLATWVLALAGAAIFSMDPTIQVAVIVAIPSLITGIGTIALGFMSRKQMQQISVNVDGKLDQLMMMKAALAHAEGRREGVDATDIQTAEKLKAAVDGRVAEGIGLSGDVQMKVDGDVNIEKGPKKGELNVKKEESSKTKDGETK